MHLHVAVRLRSLNNCTPLSNTSKQSRNVDVPHCLFSASSSSLPGRAAIATSLKRYTEEIGLRNLQCEAYASARFLNLMRANPWMVNDPNTLVTLSSKSGKTPETVAVAAFLKGKACKTVIFTESEAVELATFGHPGFFTGKTTQAFQATYMLMASFLGGVLEARENWKLLPALLSSLEALPGPLFNAAEKGGPAGEAFAAGFAEDDPLYFIASGGSAGIVSHAFGLCVLQERFGLDIHIVDSADFFHSFVETLRPGTRGHYILIIPDPEDASRGEMLDVKTFFDAQLFKVQVIDAKGLDMSGIDSRIRRMVGPIICEAYFETLDTRPGEGHR
nr:SIS domain-containing protein [Ipomoea batatas]GME19367.1 SIS domain-containing protein [Ipomoea batatas]